MCTSTETRPRVPNPHLTYITPCRDVGLVSGVEVLDVYRRGTVAVHFLAGELQPGSVVRQSLDWNRRFDNMQQHSGVQYPPYLLFWRVSLRKVCLEFLVY